MNRNVASCWYLIVLVGILVPFTGCASGSKLSSVPTPTASSFDYQVRVKSQDAGQFIQDATVIIEVGGGQAPLNALTDSNGLARLFISSAYVGKPGVLIVKAMDHDTYTKNMDLAPDALPDVVLLSKPLPTATPTFTPSPSPTPTQLSTSTSTPTVVSLTSTLAPSTPTPRSSTPTVASQATASETGWHGEYFANENWFGTPVYEREDPAISFDWGYSNPAPGVGVDYFSVRWTRCLELEERYYTFSVQTDSDVEVWLDDFRLLIGNGSQKFLVTAGRHCIIVKFREALEGAAVFFDFQPA